MTKTELQHRKLILIAIGHLKANIPFRQLPATLLTGDRCNKRAVLSQFAKFRREAQMPLIGKIPTQ